jgi:hypothetical protein
MTTDPKPVVRNGGKVYLNGQQIGEVQDNGFRLLSSKTGRVWQFRRLPWHKWQGYSETRREAVADLVARAALVERTTR